MRKKGKEKKEEVTIEPPPPTSTQWWTVEEKPQSTPEPVPVLTAEALVDAYLRRPVDLPPTIVTVESSAPLIAPLSKLPKRAQSEKAVVALIFIGFGISTMMIVGLSLLGIALSKHRERITKCLMNLGSKLMTVLRTIHQLSSLIKPGGPSLVRSGSRPRLLDFDGRSLQPEGNLSGPGLPRVPERSTSYQRITKE